MSQLTGLTFAVLIVLIGMPVLAQSQTRSIAAMGEAASLEDPADLTVRIEVPLSRDAAAPVRLHRRGSSKLRGLPRPPRASRQSATGQTTIPASLLPPLEVILATMPFGPRVDLCRDQFSFHRGVDFAAEPGAEVRAVEDGVVLSAGPLGELGSTVVIGHGPQRRSRYVHLLQVGVRSGESVERGAIIGRVGPSTESERSQLHFEYWLKEKAGGWRAQDPLSLFNLGK